MKKTTKSLLLIVTGLLAIMLLLVACDKKDPPVNDTPETQAPSDTEAPVEAPTEAPTEVPTEPEETDAPEPVTMSSDEAVQALANAITATDEKKAFKNVVNMSMSMMGTGLGKVKITEVADGDNRIFIEESEGTSSTAIFLGEKLYLASTYGTGSEQYVVTLTEDQRAWVLSMYESEDTNNSTMEFTPDQFIGLEGTKYPDGSVKLTATGLQEELVNTMLGDITESGMTDLTLDFKKCKLTISADGLMQGMELTLDMNGKVTQEGISIDVTASMTFSVEAEYEGITVTAPEGAESYVEDTFEHLFMFVPSEEEAEAGGLPLGNDSYVIGAEDSQFSADEQFLLLVSHPSAYEDKTFVIYGTVGEDEELGVSVINAGDYGTFYYYCSDGVSKPAYGDTVKITATFINTADKGYNSDYYCYTMLVSECEVLAHGMGPNGGRIMFITASSLNVRTSSDTSSSDNILGTLSYGDAVEVFEQDDKGWWRIEFNGQTAYISNKYVSETRPE